MQKKLIALAVATLASGAAFAQSNVQIYGSIDMGFSHRGDSLYNNTDSKNSIDSGISAGNRLGFKGVEDLGNGLKALFTLEAGFEADTGASTQGGRLFGRQAFVGLTGDFGTAIAGRLYTPHYTMLSTIDPFAGGTVGQYRNVMGIGMTLDGENLFDPTRVDNVVAYVSPSFSGFNVTAAYSTNGINSNVRLTRDKNGNVLPIDPAVAAAANSFTRQENRGNDGDNRVFAIMPRYTNGPLDVMVNYHQIDTFQDIKGVDEKITNWAVGGTYDFGVAKLAAFYDKNKWENFSNLLTGAPRNEDLELKTWMVGVTVPFGKHAVMASYNHSKLELGRDDGNSKQWALGYTYSLSKRTNIYAAYADISNDDGKNDLVRTTSVGDNTNGGDGYQNGFQVGLKHTF